MRQFGCITTAPRRVFRIEGVVSKRADFPYRSARNPEWVKVKAS
jgi:hypothetical protein